MIAVRCLRHANGVEIEGVKFAHDCWTIVSALTPGQELQTRPVYGFAKPLLEAFEVECASDERLRFFPVFDTLPRGNPLVGSNVSVSNGNIAQDAKLTKSRK